MYNYSPYLIITSPEFIQIPQLQTLDLGRNQLQTLEGMPTQPKLQELYLCDNQLQTLYPSNVFAMTTRAVYCMPIG